MASSRKRARIRSDTALPELAPTPTNNHSAAEPYSRKGKPTCKKDTHHGKTQLRRPLAEGEQWSTPAEIWAAVSSDRRLVLSHVGRIYETDEGIPAPYSCEECEKQGASPCMVYLEDARLKYYSQGGHACARCRFNGFPSSLKVRVRWFSAQTALLTIEQRAAEQAELDSSRRKTMREELAELRSENRLLHTENAGLETQD